MLINNVTVDLEEIIVKTRIISAIIMCLLFIPPLLIGGIPFQLLILLLSILGLKEFLDIKQTKKKLPFFIQFLSYVFIVLFLFTEVDANVPSYALDFRFVAGLFMSFLFPVIFYHDDRIYSISDAFYLIGGLFFLGSSFHLFLLLRNRSLALMIYLFLISVMTDTYAYFTGMLIGKNKLLETISPKKTIEGLIGGTVFGTLIPAYFYFLVIDPSISTVRILFVTLFLSLVGQFGDLTFSAIKRYFGKKDFSNLMPGHGGILDRFDSIIFIALGFLFFITIL